MSKHRNRPRALALAALVAAALSASPTADARIPRARAPRVPFSDLSREEMLALAKAGGPLRVRGGQRLSGRVFAESVRFEGPDPVYVEQGTEVFSTGDVVIDAPIVGLPPAERAWTKKGDPANDGANAEGYAVLTDADVQVNQPITQADGGAGKDVTVNPGASAQGGDGGDGGSVNIRSGGTVTIAAAIKPGAGGAGGGAFVTGRNGGAGENGQTVKTAVGGKGGDAGTVKIKAKQIDFAVDGQNKPTGKIILRWGGKGGQAEARGGDAGTATDCATKAPEGGDAYSKGGAAGANSTATLDAKTVTPGVFNLADVVDMDVLGPQPDGGSAASTGGKGANGAPCVSDGCPAKGRAGGSGGAGGSANATGGAGSAAGKLSAKGGFAAWGKTTGEGLAGNGGAARATGGAGGTGADGENGKAPGGGGAGGAGGKATAGGGPGGASTANPAKSFRILHDDFTGGSGGAATATGGDSGGSGKGGDCCENPSGNGARGGRSVLGAKATANGGAGGPGHPKGVDGTETPTKGGDGLGGSDGANCPSNVTDNVQLISRLQRTAFHLVPFPLYLTFTNAGFVGVPLHVEICCDGRKIGEFDIVVPPQVGLVLGTISPTFTLNIIGKHRGHRISIMVKPGDAPSTEPAKTVKNHRVDIL